MSILSDLLGGLGLGPATSALSGEQKRSIDAARLAAGGSEDDEAARRAAEAKLRRLLAQGGVGAAFMPTSPLAAPVGVRTLMGS